jgi:hypothetical protein
MVHPEDVALDLLELPDGISLSLTSANPERVKDLQERAAKFAERHKGGAAGSCGCGHDHP